MIDITKPTTCKGCNETIYARKGVAGSKLTYNKPEPCKSCGASRGNTPTPGCRFCAGSGEMQTIHACTAKPAKVEKKDTLSEFEANKLFDCETVIEKGLATFVQVGNALMDIRNGKLYRLEHKTFEDYCQARWKMTRQRANQIIAASETVTNLTTAVVKPESERIARPLTTLPPEQQQEAWDEAVAQTDGAPTTADVQQAVDKRRDLSPMMSQNSTEHYTPGNVVERVIEVLGAIDLDPCADPGKAIPATQHFTAQDDGLTKDWKGRVYMNAPYDEIELWIKKLADEFLRTHTKEAIALVAARPDTQWWWHVNVPVAFVKGRLKFSDAGSAPFPSALIYFGESWDQFAAVFNRDDFARCYIPTEFVEPR